MHNILLCDIRVQLPYSRENCRFLQRYVHARTVSYGDFKNDLRIGETIYTVGLFSCVRTQVWIAGIGAHFPGKLLTGILLHDDMVTHGNQGQICPLLEDKRRPNMRKPSISGATRQLLKTVALRRILLVSIIIACPHLHVSAQTEHLQGTTFLDQLLQSHALPADLFEPSRRTAPSLQQGVTGRRVGEVDVRDLLQGAENLGILVVRDAKLYMVQNDESGKLRVFWIPGPICDYVPWICSKRPSRPELPALTE